MSEPKSKSSNEDERSRFPLAPTVVAGVIVALGVAWYFWVLNDWNHASTWGAIGDAVGPFAGLATALALGFAVYATMLQRQELKLQREEMREQRLEMARQRKETAKAAAAQERLAESQKALAEAQMEANQLAERHLEALRIQRVVDAAAALGQIRATLAVSIGNPAAGLDATKASQPVIRVLDRVLHNEASVLGIPYGKDD